MHRHPTATRIAIACLLLALTGAACDNGPITQMAAYNGHNYGCPAGAHISADDAGHQVCRHD